MNTIFKEFENLSMEKGRFRLRWDSSPGLLISGRLQSKDPGSFPRKDFQILSILNLFASICDIRA